MAFNTFNEDMDIISKLGDEPNEENGLTAAGLKARFDLAGNKIKTFLNNLIVTMDGSTGAANIGFNSTVGVPEANVQDAIENVQAQLIGITQTGVANGSITEAKLSGSLFMQDITDEMSVSIESASSFNPASGDVKFFYSPLLRMVFLGGQVVFTYRSAQHPAGAYLNFSNSYAPDAIHDGDSVLNEAVYCDAVANIQANTCRIAIHIENVPLGASAPSVTLHGWYICEEASS